MTVLLGLDIGTTGAKAVLVDPDGRVLAAATTEYPLLMPRPGWTEQHPADWWEGSVASIRAVLGQAAVTGGDVAAIGLTGQMHGLVALDGDGTVLRPAILWNDQRTVPVDRKSTRLNSSHVRISYAVFCLKKKIHCEAPA